MIFQISTNIVSFFIRIPFTKYIISFIINRRQGATISQHSASEVPMQSGEKSHIHRGPGTAYRIQQTGER